MKIQKLLVPLKKADHQFRKTFLKNWIFVFLCIVIPLFLSSIIVYDYSNKSLLREIDNGMQRSAENTTATVRAIFDEAGEILKNMVLDEDVREFCNTPQELPYPYSNIQLKRRVLDDVSAYYRDSLYYSVDVYSGISNQVISSLLRAQNYSSVDDPSLLEAYGDGRTNGGGYLFAQLRNAEHNRGIMRVHSRLITIFQSSPTIGEGSFVSISIDNEKLISYLSAGDLKDGGSYLLVDETGKVLLDTIGILDDAVLTFLSKNEETGPMTEMISGKSMRILQNNLGLLGLRFVQTVPLTEVKADSERMMRLLLMVVLLGIIAAAIISYYVTYHLYRPVLAILRILDNGEDQRKVYEENDEFQYLLIQILELFEKNITLETTMVERTVALKSARAKALQKQMTPHFLNNVLSSINWIAIEETGDLNGRTSKALTLLAEIIRLGKEQKNNLTSVREEIEYTEKFVELERLRFGDGIICSFDVSPEVQEEQIPCLSIQVLVENAIIHGLQPKGGYGTILVRMEKQKNGGLLLSVEDSGVGFQREMSERVFTLLEQEYTYLDTNLGLANLFQRFRLIYGDKCEFSIDTGEYGGARVRIIMPERSVVS